jgi:hypothetical protein
LDQTLYLVPWQASSSGDGPAGGRAVSVGVSDQAARERLDAESGTLCAALSVPQGSDLAAKALAAGGKAVLKISAPAVPTEIIDPAKKAASLMGGSEWLCRLSLKLFRPHIHFLLTMAADDRNLRDSVVKAARIFNLSGKEVTEPLGFLERLGRISSIA